MDDEGADAVAMPAHGPRGRLNWRVVAVAAIGAAGLGLVAVVAFALMPPPVDPDIAFADVAWTKLMPPGSVVLETRGNARPRPLPVMAPSSPRV